MKTTAICFTLWFAQYVCATPLDELCKLANKAQNCWATPVMPQNQFEALCRAAPECKAYVKAGLGQPEAAFYMLGSVGAQPVGQGNHDCYIRTAQGNFEKKSGFCSDVSTPGTKSMNFICKDKGPCAPTTTVSSTTAADTSDACVKTPKTFDQGARCLSVDGVSTGETNYRKTVGWCCSEFGRNKKFQWTDAPTSATTKATTKAPTRPMKTCKSIGDPHVYPFEKAHFDNHDIGWKTLYFKGNLKIEALQKTWLLTGGGRSPVAVNAGVRYTTKAQDTLSTASWLPPNGQTLKNEATASSAATFAAPSSPNSKVSSTDIKFPNNFLTLKVISQDYRLKSNIDPTARFIYDIWITTNDFAGAKGQCAEGKTVQGSGGSGSGGIPFPTPTNDPHFMTEAEAKAACKNIVDPIVRQDCVTDVRMMNDPAFTARVVDGFSKVEAVDRQLEGKPGVEGWALGAKGKSCTDACKDIGGTCNEARLQSLKANPDGVRLAFADAGFPCGTTGHSCVTGQKCASFGAPFIHNSNVAEVACQTPGPGDETVANCGQVPIDLNHRRLCACGPARAKPAPTKLVCHSVGDPHIRPFVGEDFDTHRVGWKVLYKKDKFEVQLLQDLWDKTGARDVAINRAVKYTVDGTNWEQVGCNRGDDGCAKEGALFPSNLGWIGFGTGTSAQQTKDFTNPNVNLRVQWDDYSSVSWTKTKKIYSVYVTTDQITGSTGQCTQGKLRRALSDGVEFPKGGINQADADASCASLGDMKRNCAYDVRMGNDPEATKIVVQHFSTVERTLKYIKVAVVGKGPNTCSQQGFDFGAWCDFAATCDAAYSAAGLVLATENQRDGEACPDGSKAFDRDFTGVHKKKCCSCGGTFCRAKKAATTTKAAPTSKAPMCGTDGWSVEKNLSCNVNRDMVPQSVGWSLDQCKAKALEMKKTLFSWAPQKWCLLCHVKPDGTPIDNHKNGAYQMFTRCSPDSTKTTTKKPSASTKTTTKKPSAPMRTCKSVGDPHIYPFVGANFDNHNVGWKTLYMKGDLLIQGHQKVWLTTKNVAVNAAVRYTTNAKGDLSAASTWQKPHGQTLENPTKAPFASSAAKFAEPGNAKAKFVNERTIQFPDNHLTLQVVPNDYRTLRTVRPGLGFFYDIYLTTNDYDGAKGQCVEGKAGQDAGMGAGPPSRRSLSGSDGVAFPSGSDVKVTKEKAEEACAKIGHTGLMQDCVTDIRMVNEPDFVSKVVSAFENVEAVEKSIAEKFGITIKVTTPAVSATTKVSGTTSDGDSETDEVATSSSPVVTGLGLIVLTIIGLLL